MRSGVGGGGVGGWTKIGMGMDSLSRFSGPRYLREKVERFRECKLSFTLY